VDSTEQPARKLPTQLIAVGLFVAITAGLLAAYARSFATEDGPEAVTSHTDPRRRATVARARQFHAELRRQLGSNGRGLPVVSAVDYDPAIDRLHVIVSLDHTLDDPAEARLSGMRRVFDVLKAFQASDLSCNTVLVTATAPIPGQAGNESEGMVIRCQFPRERLDRVEWSRATPEEVPALAEQFWLYPDLDVAGEANHVKTQN
jgi:hypothetical protein